MLWKKESDEQSALYVDYFADFGDKLDSLDEIYDQTRPIKKSNSLSCKLREQGNAEFAAQNYPNAIKGYNYALCFAENGTEDVSQAYANRSAVSFQLDQFYESCTDNDLALKASNCSDELRQRIYQNKRDCLDFIHGDDSCEKREVAPKLDFKANQYFPSLANVLRIERRSELNADYGHQIVANCDIDVGQQVFVEKSPVSKLMSDSYMRCNICLKDSINLVPCRYCTNAMFCHDGCQSSILHDAECKLSSRLDVDGKISFLTRTVLYAITLFDDIDELMDFVERGNASNPSQLPQSMAHERNKYRNFTTLRPHHKIILTKSYDPQVYIAYKAILESNTGCMFYTQQHKRFLAHLIQQHMNIIALGYVHEYTNVKDQLESLNLSVTFSYFNHSCTPNAMFHTVNNWEIVTTIRPIKAGEEVFLSYFGQQCFSGTHEQRQQYVDRLYDCFKFECQCDLCKQRMATDEERTAMAEDLNYQFVSNKTRSCLLYNYKKLPFDDQQLKDHATKFLEKFGHSKWCDEIGEVAKCYMDMTWLQSSPSM